MLYQHKKTGSRVKKISELDNGEYFMVEDQDGKVFYAYDQELVPDTKATTKVQTLQVKDKAAKEEPRSFPPDMRLNICLLYTSPSPRDLSTSRMPSSA